MLILLPNEIDGLAQLKQTLRATRVWSNPYDLRNVTVKFPRFKTRYRRTLNDALMSMWLINAFSQEKADFSGIDGRQHWLYIGNILHEVFIEVNEEGTRAAAATALQYIGAVLNHPELPPVVFQADHPFLYLIIANQSQTILFMARLTDFRS